MGKGEQSWLCVGDRGWLMGGLLGEVSDSPLFGGKRLGGARATPSPPALGEGCTGVVITQTFLKPSMNFTPTTQVSGGNIIHLGHTEVKCIVLTQVKPWGLTPKT